MPYDLQAICVELRQIGQRPQTPAARAKIEEALSSKWDGVQVVAAKALSKWGDARSIHALKQQLSAVVARKEHSNAARGVAKSVYPHLQRSDLDWLIDILVHKSKGDNCRQVAYLLDAPPFAPGEVVRRLEGAKTGGGKVAEAVRLAIGRAEWRIRREASIHKASRNPK